jgi:hypothetical protein
MKLWHISQDANDGYDTYSDAVVAAETEAEARVMHPNGHEDPVDWSYQWNSWAFKPEQVTVRHIGEAVEGTPKGVICASFHAG